LVLRPFTFDDISAVVSLAGEWDVARNTLRIPHPYNEAMARGWILSCEADFTVAREMVCAITNREDGMVVGAIGLMLEEKSDDAALGYWIGKPYWGNGYATEAGKAMVAFGFQNLGLNRIRGEHFTRNPASGRVLEKIGMRRAGGRGRQVERFGELVDLVEYSIMKEEYKSSKGKGR
jgi:RimJ/RimL family protein N-acetyltransferase